MSMPDGQDEASLWEVATAPAQEAAVEVVPS